DFAADKPFCPGTIPLGNLIPFPEPMQFSGDAAPEMIGLVDRFAVELLVFREAPDVGLLTELGGRLEFALLLQNGVDICGLRIDDSLVGHEAPQPGRNSLSRLRNRANGTILHAGHGVPAFDPAAKRAAQQYGFAKVAEFLTLH